jgi:Domain of unknown function (DUF2760)
LALTRVANDTCKETTVRAMKAVSTIAVLLLLAANAAALLLAVNVVPLPPALDALTTSPAVAMFTLPPAVGALLPYVLIATVALSLIALITILAIGPRPPDASRPPAEAARPMPAPSKANAEAEIVSFLGTLQAKGRLVDFLMDDINAVNDAQIGAAARVVHAGCKSVLLEHFRIRPIREEGERSKIEVPANYEPGEYRLIGKTSGKPPFSGVLVHHGWKTDFVKLPTILHGSADHLPAIAPAEVELK